MANYCKNLWIKFNELQGAHQNCATILDSAKNEGKSQFTDLDSAISNTEATLAEMQKQWDNSFEISPYGDKLFGPEYDALEQLDDLNPGENFFIRDFRSGTLKIKDDHIHELLICDRNICDLTPLRFLKRLEELSLHNSDRRQKNSPNFDILRKLNHLESLVIVGFPITDLDPIKNLSKLRDATIGGLKIANLESLAGLSNLKKLVVSNMDKLEDIAALKKISLVSLTIDKCPNISDISAVSNSTNLDSLLINNVSVNDITPVKSLNKLTALSLISTEITDISPLANLPSLSFLCIRGESPVNDLSPILTLPNLQTVDLSIKYIDSTASKEVMAQLTQKGVKVIAY